MRRFVRPGATRQQARELVAARTLPALSAICVLAAALRFATLDVQSLWFDEAVTAQLMKLDFESMLTELPGSESTPPLYYALVWPWTHVLGTGEVGLRSLSALFGVASVVVIWALARRLAGDAGGLLAALLAAVNPMLVWFGQEARSYALLTLLAALVTLLWLRALESPRRGRLLAWGAIAALILATHYFALFLVAPQAIWLALRLRGWHERLIALALPVSAAAALLPLALEQRGNDNAAFIEESALLTRVAQIPKQFLTGYDAPGEALLTALAALAMAAGLAGAVALVRNRAGGEQHARSDAARVAAVAACALLAPLAAALLGEDHLLARNTIAVLPLVIVLTGAGLVAAMRVLPRAGPALAAGLACAVGLVAVIGVVTDTSLQRDDWRGAARALGRVDGIRIVAAPGGALEPLRYYLPHVHAFTHGGAFTPEVDYLAMSLRRENTRLRPPHPAGAPLQVPGFTETGRTLTGEFTVLRLRARAPLGVFSSAVATGLDGKPAAPLLVTPP